MSLTKFEEFLKNRNIKKVKLARSLNIDSSQLNLFAKGRHNWNRRQLKMMVTHFRVSPNQLLDWEKWIEEADQKKAKKKPPAEHGNQSVDSSTDVEDKT